MSGAQKNYKLQNVKVYQRRCHSSGTNAQVREPGTLPEQNSGVQSAAQSATKSAAQSATESAAQSATESAAQNITESATHCAKAENVKYDIIADEGRGKRRRVQCERFNDFITQYSLRKARGLMQQHGIRQLFPQHVQSNQNKTVELTLVKSESSVEIEPSCEPESKSLLEYVLAEDSEKMKRKTRNLTLKPAISGDETYLSSGRKRTNSAIVLVSPEKVRTMSVNSCIKEKLTNDGTDRPPNTAIREHAGTAKPSKRKHAICAIFENIWKDKTKPENPKVAKPINGFRELFDNIFTSKAATPCTPVLTQAQATPVSSTTCPLRSSPVKRSPPSIRTCPQRSSAVKRSPQSVAVDSNCATLASPDRPANTPSSHNPDCKPSNAENSNIQRQCHKRSRQLSIQLKIRKTVRPADRALRTEHRKKRRRKSSRKRACPVTDADDEQSADEAPRPTWLSGPLKSIAIQDLWMQKAFYLRYLCNFYTLPNLGCKECLISRLHQYMLHASRTSSRAARPAYLKYRKVGRRDQATVSWVALTAKYKCSRSSETTATK